MTKKYNWHLCPACKHYKLKNQKHFCQISYTNSNGALGSKKVLICSDFETKEGSDFKLDEITRKAVLDIQNELAEKENSLKLQKGKKKKGTK